MVPPHSRLRPPRRRELFALTALGALVLFSLLVGGASAAGAASAPFALAGTTLAVSPTNLASCRQCMVTVLNQSPNRSLTWVANSRGIPGVTVNPAGGTLPRKGQVSVMITVPSNIPCPANDTITFSGPANTVNVTWSCQATPMPSRTPSPATPAPTPTSTPVLPPSSTPSASPTPTAGSPGLTPTATSVPNGTPQQTQGNSPPTSGSRGSAVPSILLSVAALLLALCAFALYLMSPAQASPRNRLLSLVLPAWVLRKLDQHR